MTRAALGNRQNSLKSAAPFLATSVLCVRAIRGAHHTHQNSFSLGGGGKHLTPFVWLLGPFILHLSKISVNLIQLLIIPEKYLVRDGFLHKNIRVQIHC